MPHPSAPTAPQYAELHCHSTFSLLDGASDPEAPRGTRPRARLPGARAHRPRRRSAARCASRRRRATAGLGGILGRRAHGGRSLTRRHGAHALRTCTAAHRAARTWCCSPRRARATATSRTLITRARMDHPRGAAARVARHSSRSTRAASSRSPGARAGGCRSSRSRRASRDERPRRAAGAAGRRSSAAASPWKCWDHAPPRGAAPRAASCIPLATSLDVPWVVTNDVHYALPRRPHRARRARRAPPRRTLDDDGHATAPERRVVPEGRRAARRALARGTRQGSRHARDRRAVRVPAASSSSRRCRAFPLPPGVGADEYLARLVEQGAQRTVGLAGTRRARHDKQLAHELTLIAKLGLAGYFLIVWDIVRFARREGILCQGRGSAANSAVCYCLGITAVDPIQLELLFERFLSEERAEPPDIDIDFAHRERERVLQYVYDALRTRARGDGVRAHHLARAQRGARRGARAGLLAAAGGTRWRRSATGSARRARRRRCAWGPPSERGGRRPADRSRRERDPFAPERADAMATRTHQSRARAARCAPATLARRRLRVEPGMASATQATHGDIKAPGARRAGREKRALKRMRRARKAAGARGCPDTSRRSVRAGPRLGCGPRQANVGRDVTRAAARAAVHRRHRSGRLANEVDDAARKTRRTTGSGDAPAIPPGNALLESVRLDPTDPRVQRPRRHRRRAAPAPRHRSIHVGGFVLTAEPLGTVVPIEPASMPGRTVIQWEKDDLDPVGLVKIDLLGLGMLTVLQDCLAYLRTTRGLAIDLGAARHAPTRPCTTICARADTVGVFQVESRAQMNTLPRLKPRCFYDLVVEVALIRPGPIQGDMVHPYLRRRAGVEEVTYPHPSVEHDPQAHARRPALPGAGDAGGDRRRGLHARARPTSCARAMGHKRSRERMAAICEKLHRRHGGERDRRRHRAPDLQPDQRLRRLRLPREPRGELRAHRLRHARTCGTTTRPEFTAAMLNAQPMGFYAPGTLIEDAKRHGVKVRPVDVTRSAWDHTSSCRRVVIPHDGTVQCGARRAAPMVRTLEDRRPPAVRLGLRLVRGLAQAREDSSARCRTALHQHHRLRAAHRARPARAARARRSGRVRCVRARTEPPARRRRVALWRVLEAQRAATRARSRSFAESRVPPPSPGVRAAGTHRRRTIASPGSRSTATPCGTCATLLAPNGVRTARDLHTTGATANAVAHAGLVICRQRPGTAKGFVFLTLEDETGMINVVVTPKRFERQALLISTLTAAARARGAAGGAAWSTCGRSTFGALRAGSGEDAVKGHNYH